MKTMKRMLSLVLAVCLVLGMATTAFAAEYTDLELVYDEDYINATATIELQQGEIKYVQAGLNGELVFTMDNAEGLCVVYKGKTYEPVNGTITFTVSGTRWEPCKFEIANASDKSGTYTISFTYPLGTQMNPDKLVIGTNTASIAAGDSDGYQFSWIAAADGKLTVTMDTNADWTYVVHNVTAGIYGAYRWSDDMPVLYSQTVKVSAGDEVQVMVNTYNPKDEWNNPAGDVVFTVSTTAPASKFTDLKEGKYYSDAMDFMVGNGLMNGTGDTTMSPSAETNRAMMATLLYRFAGQPSVEGLENPFKDVPSGKYYTNAVIWAADEGIVNGLTEDTFGPTSTLTRQQLVTMLWRFAGKPEADASVMDAFKDAATVGNSAKEAVAWAIENGIITGLSETEIGPKGNAVRAQFATILFRYLQN